MNKFLIAFSTLGAAALGIPFPDGTIPHGVPHGAPHGAPHALPIPHVGGDGSYGKDVHGKYFMYTNVQSPKDFEWGYRRGQNPGHFREEYLSQHDHAFKAKVKWGDEYGGYGEHFYDINHVPKYKPHEPSYHPEPAYHPEPHAPVYKAPHVVRR